MFTRYTEKARRVVFRGRYEASLVGSPYIETEHLLLGLLGENKALTDRFRRSHASVESIRKQIEGHTTLRKKVSTSVDLPLSNECKRVLVYAAEEAECLSHKYIGTEHLLLGLLREEKCFAAEVLRGQGLTVSAIREELAPGDQELRQPQRQRASGRRRPWIQTAALFALLSLFAVGLAKSTITGRYLLVMGTIWFGVVVAWNFLAPSSFFWSFGERNRVLAKATIHPLLWLFELFTFGWLVLLGVGIYRVTVR